MASLTSIANDALNSIIIVQAMDLPFFVEVVVSDNCHIAKANSILGLSQVEVNCAMAESYGWFQQVSASTGQASISVTPQPPTAAGVALSHFRVLGFENNVIDCHSNIIIFAPLNILGPTKDCKLPDVYRAEWPISTDYTMVSLEYRSSLREYLQPKPACGCSSTYASTAVVPLSQPIYREQITSYSDSWQPTGGHCGKFPHEWPKTKQLQHNLYLEVDGPDRGDVIRCLQEAGVAAALAAVVAAYATAGAALHAAEVTFTEVFLDCIGRSYSVNFPDESHWVYNC